MMNIAATVSQRTFTRSSESRAFEAFWRSLRGELLVPAREDFHPGKARNFLGDITLAVSPDRSGESLLLKVVGSRLSEMIGNDLTGCNPFDLLPRAHRAGAIESTRLMFETPCGVWQVSPAHLVCGYAMHLEITMLPLYSDKTSLHYLLCHVRSLGDLMSAHLPTHNGLGLDTATTFEFLDIGAGLPAWTAQAA